LNGLETDPRRQANDALRGYVYQILRSVQAWIALGDNDELILEGAEDLDHILGDKAEVEQVKDTAGSGPITLRTGSVREAIGHYCSHVRRNPDYRIQYRYLTTAEITVEQGAPFGAGRAGLALWTAIQNDPASIAARDDATALAAFLVADAGVSGEVRAFCQAASPDLIIERLILPIRWVVGQGDGNTLVRQIKDALVAHGHGQSIPARESEKAFDPLYVAAFDAAQRKGAPPLTRGQFLRIFDAATTIQLRTQDLAALVQRAIAAPGFPGALAPAAAEAALEERPPLARRYFRRSSHESRLLTQIDLGPVVIQGMTGTGKTLLVASALRDRPDIGWLNLRDLGPQEVRTRLVAARAAVRQVGRGLTVILDDLDGSGDPRPFEAALGALAASLAEFGGHLVITSAHEPSARLVQQLDLPADAIIAMPGFEEDEIAAFLAREGCPADAARVWATIIFMTSAGHSQLVHARIASLAAANFPPPIPSDFIGSTPDVAAVRTEARRLIAALPEGPRELLYRLSLISGRMTRRRLMGVAGAEPAIPEPGATVDLVAGPWLEKTGDDEYRVSPLVREAGTLALGQPWARAMHGKLSWVYMLERTVTPLDISAILTHCLLSGSSGPIAYLMQSLFTASDEVWEQIADASSMFTLFGLDDATPLPFTRSTDLLIFRHIQYRIAVYGDIDVARRIAARFEQEVQVIEPEEGTEFFRFLFISQLLAQPRVTYPIAALLGYTREFHRLAYVLEESYPKRLASARLKLKPNESTPDYRSFIAYPLMQRIETLDDLVELLDALDDRPDDEILNCLAALAGERMQSSWIGDRLWLAEYRRSDPRWLTCAATFRRLVDQAVRLEIAPLALGIAPTLVRVIDEDCNDMAGALAEAERRRAELGDDAALMCAIAKVKKRAGDLAEALEIWEANLPLRTDEEGKLAIAFDMRTAAETAGRLGAWDKAEKLLSTALELTGQADNPTFALGLRADAAFAAFLDGRHEKALERFESVIGDLEPLQPGLAQEPLLSLQRRIGGVIAMLNNLDDPKTPRDAPANLAAFCSTVDPLTTEATHPLPLDFILRDLFEIETRCAATLRRAKRYADRLRSSPYLSLQLILTAPLLTLATRTGDVAPIVSDGVRQLRAATIANRLRGDDARWALSLMDDSDPDWPQGFDQLLVMHVLIAVLEMARRGRTAELPVAVWREALPDRPHARELRRLVDWTDGLFMSGTIDAWAAIRDGSAGWADQMIAAIAATTEQPRTPGELLRCHGLWVHYTAQRPIHDLAGPAMAELVADQWSNICLIPSQLDAPSRVPFIRRAIDREASPWRRTKAILSAALSAVRIAGEDPLRAQIAGIAVEPDEEGSTR